ncbi:lysozyme inhibitor LprI family protein [Massilia alkalitolerans]|uniref:lysozyme inhibitor LprI family protein n=1 Tax=Massilia alkalitolerans TaxID=286638 RepID=UPI00041EDB35|nr:lysozyme inhibitor LprI family protein [Massilia alkalitolerans]
MVKLSLVILSTALLVACTKEAPKCSEPSTLALVKQILLDEMSADAETKKLVDSYISFENTRPSAFDEKIRKFSCEASMSVRAGGEGSGSYNVPIEFESQLDDKGDHIVAVTKLLPGDRQQVVAHLNAALAHAKPAPAPAAGAEAPQDGAADAAAASEPASSGDTASTVETAGICQGLDLAVTVDQSECIGRKFAIADKQLNEDYKRLMASLSPERQAELKSTQRAWIQEKERACEEAGKEAEGGTLQPILIGDCTVRMTQERIAFLARFR